jgi:hypothetical protein
MNDMQSNTVTKEHWQELRIKKDATVQQTTIQCVEQY